MSKEEISFLDNDSMRYMEEISDKIQDNRVVLFAGAGLSRNARRKDGNMDKKIPLWEDLSIEMLNRLYGDDETRIENEKRFYLDVADKFEAVYGRDAILHLLEEMLEDPEFDPGEIHQLISRFNWEVITTNFDTLIERGYEFTNKIPNIITADPDLAFLGAPRIFKINGCIKHAREQIIISGEDFRTYSNKKPLIELYVKKCFIEKTVLFVGFSLDDPEFKMIHGWVRDRLLDKRANRFAYSIRLYADEKTKRIWNPRGINFIELYRNGKIDGLSAEERLTSIFRWLYKDQSNNRRTAIAIAEKENNLCIQKKIFLESLSKFEENALSYQSNSILECPDIQAKLEKHLVEAFKLASPYNFFEFCFEDIEFEKKINKNSYKKIIDYFIALLDAYLLGKYREAILYYIFKEIIGHQRENEFFKNQKFSNGIRQIIESFMIGDKSKELNNNPNLWIVAMYIGLGLCLNHKIFPLEFFKTGFSILTKAANGEGEQKLSTNLYYYCYQTLMFIGPFKCAKDMLKICRKTSLQKFEWNIPSDIHFQLEAFLGKRLKHLALFLTVVNKFRTTNKTEAYYKFLLLENFLKEYKNNKELNFSDLFIEDSYQTLSGMFSEKLYEYRKALSEIHYPLESEYYQKSFNAFFHELLKGRSLLCTEISSYLLSLPTFDMAQTEEKVLRNTSIVEIVLLAMIYDILMGERKKQQDLQRFMASMIEKQLIDVSYFLQLLLFRLEGAELEELDQEKDLDNGISRYFVGLVSFISKALAHLEDGDLRLIKEMIQSCLPGLKINKIREAMVEIVGYLAAQLPQDDFSSIYKEIFSLAERDEFESPIFHYLNLTQKDAAALKYPRFRLILDNNLENLGTSKDRDFLVFLLNHKRSDLIPKDEAIENQLDIYINFRVEMDNSDLSLQWLMDLQQFIEKEYISLKKDKVKNGIEKRIKEFFEHAIEYSPFYFDWKYLAEKMIPVYKTFSNFMEPLLVDKIMDGFLKNAIGKDIPMSELSETHANGFAHQLKEIYECPDHKDLKDKTISHAKNLIKKGFYGGGYLGAFWDALENTEKELLSKKMLSMWTPPEEKTIIKAIQATGQFLRYQTDNATMDELSRLVTFTALYSSPCLRIETLKLFSLHAKENTKWFQDYRERILNLLQFLRQEKDLALLRELILFLRTLQPAQITDTIAYLKEKDNTPYAEIRRAAGRV